MKLPPKRVLKALYLVAALEVDQTCKWSGKLMQHAVSIKKPFLLRLLGAIVRSELRVSWLLLKT
jgi:hypothetical protein